MIDAAILDVDGTLVDSNYQHTIAWDRALREHGVSVPLWRIHRHIGVGGDQMVARVAGEQVERRVGDAVRETEADRYADLVPEVRVLPGARELVAALADRGVRLVLASSAKQEEVDTYVDMLGARDLAQWTTSADVDRTKPAPDLIEAALERAGTRNAIVIGDTTWDVEAAGRAGIPAIGVLTGGFARAELSEAGAIEVYESVMDLHRRIDESALGG
jgi:HAD superfamily hydrolase (TIGR01509 family)